MKTRVKQLFIASVLLFVLTPALPSAAAVVRPVALGRVPVDRKVRFSVNSYVRNLPVHLDVQFIMGTDVSGTAYASAKFLNTPTSANWACVIQTKTRGVRNGAAAEGNWTTETGIQWPTQPSKIVSGTPRITRMLINCWDNQQAAKKNKKLRHYRLTQIFDAGAINAK